MTVQNLNLKRKPVAANEHWPSNNHAAFSERTVFDRGHDRQMIEGRNYHGYEAGFMRRTSRDGQPARRVVTAAVLGDPPPGRSAQDMRDGGAYRTTEGRRR
jgi:hypothetical protein